MATENKLKEKYLLSVIIPVYNAEKYLNRCLESVCNQTYNNLEVLLVDDGSSDSSGAICDNYADKDSRVKVFHVTNGGQASARNIGLSHATGQYITFVDNDDWIDDRMYEKLMELVDRYNCPITGCATIKEFSDGAVHNEYTKMESGIRSGKQCNIDILYQNSCTWGALWNKIYKKELWEGISFPSGKQLEDYVVITKLFNSADQVYFFKEPMHHYSMREDSQSKKGFSDQKLSVIESAEAIRDYFLENSKDVEILDASNYFVFNIMVMILWGCYRSDYDNKKGVLKSYKKRTIIELKKNLFNIKNYPRLFMLIAKLVVINLSC